MTFLGKGTRISTLFFVQCSASSLVFPRTTSDEGSALAHAPFLFVAFLLCASSPWTAPRNPLRRLFKEVGHHPEFQWGVRQAQQNEPPDHRRALRIGNRRATCPDMFGHPRHHRQDLCSWITQGGQQLRHKPNGRQSVSWN